MASLPRQGHRPAFVSAEPKLALGGDGGELHHWTGALAAFHLEMAAHVQPAAEVANTPFSCCPETRQGAQHRYPLVQGPGAHRGAMRVLS